MTNADYETTIPRLFAQRVQHSGPAPALYIKRSGSYQPMSWDQIMVDVQRMAAALCQLGVGAGDRVVQFADNSYHWIISDLAIQTAQAVHVPVHAPLAGEQAAWQIRHSGARIVLLGEPELVNRLAAVASSLPANLHYVCFAPTDVRIQGHPVHWLSHLLETADDRPGTQLVEQSLSAIEPDALATILYTSGTTGQPKGVMLSQRNLASNAIATVHAFGIQPSDLRLCFLPLSHIFARTCDLYTWIVRGSELALAESRETILPDCVRLGPTMLNGVPYFYQRVHRYLDQQGRAHEPDSLRKVLGGRIRLCCCGGAALPDSLYDFFARHEIPLLQGYGLTECSPVVSLNSLHHQRRGTVGRPIPDVEVKIAPDGEVLVRGPNCMTGYWHDPEATRQMIRDGWLHTGDLGYLDDDGYLSITGRTKELIITAAGKNVVPAYLESLLTEDPLIAQAVVIGEGRNYLTALIVPDPERLRSELKNLWVLPISRQWVLRHPRVLALYERIIRERLACVSHHEQIRKFTLMDRGFTVESGEMTPKLSLKRHTIEQNCRDLIEAMYRSDSPSSGWQVLWSSLKRRRRA